MPMHIVPIGAMPKGSGGMVLEAQVIVVLNERRRRLSVHFPGTAKIRNIDHED
jgi:hypothetical protein